ncbi:hypothetical protein [Methylobacterium aquaticum]|uniref:hypothetical protein n=1 Tax=Methylobacterium aquaticum TaxID=270351 RepID=UPI001FEF2FD9|nr:hypothetical protein [Methylobacterium aquaticum]
MTCAALDRPLAWRIAAAGTPKRVDIWFRLSLAPTVMVVPPAADQPAGPPVTGAAAATRGVSTGAETWRFDSGAAASGAESGRDWIGVERTAGATAPASGRLPVAPGSPLALDENGFENGSSRTASVLQAADAPPISPMRAKRDSARIPLPVPRSGIDAPVHPRNRMRWIQSGFRLSFRFGAASGLHPEGRIPA